MDKQRLAVAARIADVGDVQVAAFVGGDILPILDRHAADFDPADSLPSLADGEQNGRASVIVMCPENAGGPPARYDSRSFGYVRILDGAELVNVVTKALRLGERRAVE